MTDNTEQTDAICRDCAVWDRMRYLEEWKAHHEGRAEERDQSDRRWYEMVERTLRDHGSRLTALEKKVVWVSAFAAALGAIAGALLSRGL